MKLRRNEDALVGIELTNPEKLKIGSVGKEHAFGFHNGIRKIASRDIIILLSVETKETRTQITDSVNIQFHLIYLQKI